VFLAYLVIFRLRYIFTYFIPIIVHKKNEDELQTKFVYAWWIQVYKVYVYWEKYIPEKNVIQEFI
jgi:hypothetical protein